MLDHVHPLVRGARRRRIRSQRSSLPRGAQIALVGANLAEEEIGLGRLGREPLGGLGGTEGLGEPPQQHESPPALQVVLGDLREGLGQALETRQPLARASELHLGLGQAELDGGVVGELALQLLELGQRLPGFWLARWAGPRRKRAWV